MCTETDKLSNGNLIMSTDMSKEDEIQILSLRQIEIGLKDKKLYSVSDATELSYPTLKKLADGVKGNYTLDTLQKVSKYLSGKSDKIEN